MEYGFPIREKQPSDFRFKGGLFLFERNRSKKGVKSCKRPWNRSLCVGILRKKKPSEKQRGRG
jgi:hypothetical protein